MYYLKPKYDIYSSQLLISMQISNESLNFLPFFEASYANIHYQAGDNHEHFLF